MGKGKSVGRWVRGRGGLRVNGEVEGLEVAWGRGWSGEWWGRGRFRELVRKGNERDGEGG